MSTKEIFFIFNSFDNGDIVVNLLLRSALDSKVTKLQWIYIPLEQVKRISSFIHEIDLCDNTDCSFTFRVDFSS